VLADGQLLGGPGGVVLIGDAAQSNLQGANGAQSGGGIQNSTNALVNAELIGSGLGDLLAVGSVSQSNDQGANTTQSATGSPKQNSLNALINVVILGD
jgi:hypothetical protein